MKLFKELNVIYVPLHMGDWERGAIGMDALEEGAFFRVTRALYAAKGQIRFDDRRFKRICGIYDNRTWKRVWPEINNRFEISDEGVLTHSRVTRELILMQEKSDQAKRNAEARWRKNHNKINIPNMRANCQSNANHKPESRIQVKKVNGKNTLFDPWAD